MDIDSIGMTLAGRYRLDALLGEGGMGRVFSAVDLALDRPVAIKTLRPEYASQPDVVARFVREAKVVAQLASNPHVITIHDLCVDGPAPPFIVAERLHGRSLRVLLRELGRPSRTWILDVGVQIALALVDVHARGITHGDIKPGNIFHVEAPGLPLLVKLIDFGLSRSTKFARGGSELGTIAGTVRYLAPELIDGAEPTAASDIYSFGIVLYELASGGYPYEAASMEELLTAHREAIPADLPTVGRPFPESFRVVVRKMLNKESVGRPAASECLDALRLADRELEKARGL